MKKIIFVLPFLLFTLVIQSQEIRYIDQHIIADSIEFDKTHLYTIDDTTQYVYSRPKKWKWIPNAFVDLYEVPHQYWKKETIAPALGIAALTGVLIAFDGEIYDKTRQFSDYIGLAPTNNTINLTGDQLFAVNVPTDLPSALYYIGDGITEMSICGGFYIFGLAKKDTRAMTTASELAEGMIAVGITVQILKHLTMRETPEKRSEGYPNGKWKWFDITHPGASIKEYSRSVPSNDAFPSGHLITAMMTTTVIAKNYPEKRWIKPVAYSLMTLCGFQMVNNGVHWASDYPLALGLGYAFGNVIVHQGRQKVQMRDERAKILGERAKYDTPKLHFKLRPTLLYYDVPGLSLSLKI
jgi:hypothetical protein